MKFRFVSHREHSVSIRKTDQRTLFKEIIAVCCGNHRDHINTIRGQNLVFLLYNLTVRSNRPVLAF